MNLSLELRVPLPILRHLLTSDDVLIYRAYQQDYGFPTDRLEAATAIAGAAVASSNGAKLKPADLIPQFSPPEPVSYEVGAAHLAAYLGKLKGKRTT